MTTQRKPDNWRKSSWSSSNPECVEVANDAVRTLVRDTKNRAGGHLAVTAASWAAFTTTVKTHR